MTEPWQQRVAEEFIELTAKIDKLEKFLWGDAFLNLDRSNQLLLAQQHAYMIGYHNVLRERIKRFKE